MQSANDSRKSKAKETPDPTYRRRVNTRIMSIKSRREATSDFNPRLMTGDLATASSIPREQPKMSLRRTFELTFQRLILGGGLSTGLRLGLPSVSLST